MDEFLFDGFAFGVVADDAAAAVSFEEEDLQLLFEAALTVDSVGFLLRLPSVGSCAAGSWAGGFRDCFRGHVGLSFFGFAGRRTRARCVVRREIVRFVVNRLAPADFRSVASLAPFAMTPNLHRLTLINGRRLSDAWRSETYVVLRLTK
jgi:hypothetical protein